MEKLQFDDCFCQIQSAIPTTYFIMASFQLENLEHCSANRIHRRPPTDVMVSVAIATHHTKLRAVRKEGIDGVQSGGLMQGEARYLGMHVTNDLQNLTALR